MWADRVEKRQNDGAPTQLLERDRGAVLIGQREVRRGDSVEARALERGGLIRCSTTRIQARKALKEEYAAREEQDHQPGEDHVERTPRHGDFRLRAHRMLIAHHRLSPILHRRAFGNARALIFLQPEPQQDHDKDDQNRRSGHIHHGPRDVLVLQEGQSSRRTW